MTSCFKHPEITTDTDGYVYKEGARFLMSLTRPTPTEQAQIPNCDSCPEDELTAETQLITKPCGLCRNRATFKRR